MGAATNERRSIAGARLRGAARWAPLVVATALLASRAIAGVLAKVGYPGAALDDAYIHFQYARAFAEGHPFRFFPGEPISTGATSALWPALLAPFYAVGFRGEAILWPAWVISFTALGALAYEAYALARPLAGRAAAIGAGAMTLSFSGFAWSATSGMEVVPFAWAIAATTRRACTWAEEPGGRSGRALATLLGLAAVCPLLRPEGAITALAAGGVVALRPPRAPQRVADLSRAAALPFGLAALAPSILSWALTGSATSSTARVKLLHYTPYLDVMDTALSNAGVLAGTLLNGEAWSAGFLPSGGAPIAFAGLAALALRGVRTKLTVRAALVLLLALSVFVPCLYVTFLWNRLRYLWPFATGWIVALACLARALGSLVARVDRRAAAALPGLVAGALAGMFASRLGWVLEDVAQSASGIDRQQVALGRWAREQLPPDARIGVNDTGAIAYFGGRKTFDVVGLTTPSEGPYWVAGPASRLEHYERLQRSSPGALPTHFIVYPDWMACDPVLGRTLHEATVSDATILGGQTMRASAARWDLLGTGELPWTPLARIDDALDVADLESEREHGYDLAGARDGEQVVREGSAPDGRAVLDGGRGGRTRERFFVNLPAEGRLVGVARVEARARVTLAVRAAGQEAGRVVVEPGPFREVAFEIPKGARGARVEVEVTADAPFASYHYWFGAPSSVSSAGQPAAGSW